MAANKTWKEKLTDKKDLPRIEQLSGKMSAKWGTGTMVIPAPLEVDAVMKKVPLGRLVTINGVRVALARKHHTTIACPMTTGIFAWIAAHAAEEDAVKGAQEITPYWRTLKSGGELNPKYPGGVQNVKKRLESEGHTVVMKGKKYLVENYEKSLVKV